MGPGFWRTTLVAIAALAAGLALYRVFGVEEGVPELPGFYVSQGAEAAAQLPLVDTQGRPARLADYRGRALVLFFGFVRCPDVCPTRLYELAQAMKALGPDRERVQVLLVTVDPERDTPALLKGYVAAFDPAFGGLTGTTAQVDALAKRLYVAYRKVPLGADYTMDHSAATYLVDPQGRAVWVSGVDTTQDQLLAALRALVR